VILRSELLAFYHKLLTPELFEDYAPHGLQIEGCERVKKIAFAVSATHESIDQAIAWGAHALVVHHGVLWKYQAARPLTGAWGERLKKCMKADLNLIAYHLPLDAHLEVGNAASLARELNLVEIEPFGKYKRQFSGVKAKLSHPQKASEFAKVLETKLNHQILTAVSDSQKLISSIGIITGGANNDWVQAHELGLDAYLTGEISEYNWHDAREAGIAFFAGGHHATEKFGPQALMKKTQTDLNLEVVFFDSHNPA
jgi:dinuclear metal center YbgI/SA1388 family protein